MAVFTVPPPDDEPWPTLGPLVCDWIEDNLIHGPGDIRGEPARLDDETRGLIYRMYEVFPADHERAGRRRFTRVGISLRKGTAKTEKAAWIAAAELHPDAPVRCDGFDAKGEPVGIGVRDPYIPLVAYTEEQTEELAYGALYAIVSEGPLADDFDIGLERIMRKDGEGKAEALASSPSARDGARTTFQHFDEPLALDTPVPTTDGWKTIGEITEGDYVFGRDGHPVRVIGGSPVQVGRLCYRVTFDDETSIVTDGAHRWKAIDWGNRPKGEQVITTAEMVKRGIETGYGPRWRLPRNAGFDGTTADLPINPYLLGLWIGDGATNSGYIHSSPEDYVELAGDFDHTRSNDARPGVIRWLPTGLRTKLRLAGLIGHKHIPAKYLTADRAQRLALLRGLMDSDGHTTPEGCCTFVQNRRALCEQVADLVRSLGARATIRERTDERSRTGVMVKVTFSPAFCPFGLSRKAEKAEWVPRKCTTWPTIVAIEPTEPVAVRCIAVDSDDHLFLAGRGLHLTHNTHHWHARRLIEAHRSMLANIPKRMLADAWTLETTTAFTPGEGSVAEGTMDYAKEIAEGEAEDPRLFFFHRQASGGYDLEQEADVRKAIVEASGPAAKWSNVDSVIDLWRSPQTDRAYFERVWLNRPTQSARQAFDAERFMELAADGKPEPGTLITLGFDGSRTNDATAIVGTVVETGHQFLVGVWERPPRVNEWEVPRDDVDRTLDDAMKTWQVWRLYADPPYWDELVDEWAGRYGTKKVVKWWTNSYVRMAQAVRVYRDAIANGEMTYDGDERFAAHIGAAQKHEINKVDDDGNPLFYLEKERRDSPEKIDIAVAAVLSWEARGDAKAAGAKPRSSRAAFL